MYNKGPFANWVPKPVMLLLMLVILLSTLTISGVYPSVLSDLSGAMATYTEYITLANNAGTIGMGLSILVLMRFKLRFRSKEIIATSAILLAILSYVCGTTDNPWILVICSLLIGFIKMFPMIEMILPMMFIISPTGDRGKFYAVFYPLSIGFSQVSGYYFAEIVFNGSWQSPYFMMAAIMLIIALLSLIFQHNQRFAFKMPLYQIDWLTVVLLAGSFMSFNYFLVFMKQEGWFVSPTIVGTLLLGIILFGLTIYRQRFLKRKLIDFSVLKRANVIHALILLVVLGIYLASTSSYLQYTIGVLGYTNLINADINLWMIPGIAVAGILAFVGFNKNWHIRYFIAMGFMFFALHTLVLYFIIQPQMDIRYLEYAMLLKGLGLGILFIGIWFYSSLNLSTEQFLGIMSILIIVRSFLGTAIGTAIVGWAGYQAQWQSMSDMSNFWDVGSIPNGMAIYQASVLNSVMTSAKIIFGTLTWLIVPILIFVMTHSYGRFNYRRVVLLRKKIRGNQTEGYRLS